MNTLKSFYLQNVVPALYKEFQYRNLHEIPKVLKIQISCGLGCAAQNKSFLEKAISEIRIITGQQPILTKAKKSISDFKIRENMPIGLTTTLRRIKMYSFLEKLNTLVFPRIKDFRGLKRNSFDKYGNYNFGIVDQLVFPEIDFNTVEQKRGFNITIVTSAKTSNEGLFLLKALGFPFAKE